MKKILVLLALILLACGSSKPSVVDPPTQTELIVTYKVIGSFDADLTIRNETGNTEQFDIFDSDWHKTFKAQPGQFLYVSAQNNAPGTITCKIEVNGLPIEEASSTGRHKIASCSGSVK